MLEDKYGTLPLMTMAAVTACVTGLLSVTLLRVGLLGASGIVFCFVMLSSFSNVQARTVPITTVAVAVLYLGQELYRAMFEDEISQFAHIMGGACGALFGYFEGSHRLLSRAIGVGGRPPAHEHA